MERYVGMSAVNRANGEARVSCHGAVNGAVS